MDAADTPANTGIMIAFLPTTSDWCKQDLPHMTLVYAGTTDKRTVSDFNSLAKDTATIAMLYHSFPLAVTGLDVFGPDNDKVDVLRLQVTPELLAMRRIVDRWNASEHPFNPHATIGPASGTPPEHMPTMLIFDRVMVGWGDENITFKL